MTHESSEPADRRQRLEAATYSVAQLSDLLGVSERHIHRLRDQKKLPGELRIGKAVRFSKSIIDRWLATAVTPVTR